MNVIEPSVVEYVQVNPKQHIARCARICYKAENKGETADDKEIRDGALLRGLAKKGHHSMFRHASYYYAIWKECEDYYKIRGFLVQYNKCPYIQIHINPQGVILVATNGNFIYDEHKFAETMKPYLMNIEDFKCFEEAYLLLRFTFVVTTQIAVTRELNRVSPNAIAEQSTRFVGSGGKGVTFCKPFFYDNCTWFEKLIIRTGWKLSEWNYLIRKKIFKDNNIARGALPLESYTVAAYTYSLKEWTNILDLRYYGTTGKPNSDAFIIASKIRDILHAKGYAFPESSITIK